MKKMFGAALLAIPLLTAQAQAHGFGCCFGPYNVQAGITFGANFSVTPGCGPGGGGGGALAGPWYLYWPMEAHFQTPALPQYPYWPSPQSLPPGMGLAMPGAPGGAYPAAAGYGASAYHHGY
jgi:hypothetical protein